MSLRIFVSSVQAEFAEERRRLAEYIRSDALLADFFDVFLFEEQPTPEFDPAAGTFRTVIWRSGYGPRDLHGGESGFKSTGCGKCPSRGRVRVESQGRVGLSTNAILVALSDGPLGKLEIAKRLGRAKVFGYLSRCVEALNEDKLIEMTLPDKPNSRLQKYRLTVKGRCLAAKR